MNRQKKFDHTQIVELKLRGFSNKDIKSIVGCGYTLIFNVLRAAGLTNAPTPLSQQEVQFIRDNYERIGAKKCAEHLNKAAATITQYASKNKIYYKKQNNTLDHAKISDADLKQPIKYLESLGYSEYYIKKERKKRNILKQKLYTHEEIDFITINYPTHGMQYCIDYLKISKNRFKNIISKLNIKKNTRYDCVYVDCPDPYMSYTLGLLTADGYVSNYASKQRAINIGQNVNDIIPILPILYKHINWHLKSYINNGWGKKIMINLHLGDRHNIFWKKLNTFGFDKKTYCFPNFQSYINDDMIKYYIRGFLDGDGHVCVNKKWSGGCIGFTGHKECNWNSMLEYLNKQQIKYKVYIQHNCSRLIISRQESLRLFIESIYQQDGIYMPRKFHAIQRLYNNLSK